MTAGGGKSTGGGRAPRPERRATGFLHAAALAAGPMREASAKRGFAETRILTDWAQIVGETLARGCLPLRVSYSGKSFGATLVVEAEGARAPEVEMQAPRIVERVNAHYGYRAVSRLKVVQTGRLAAARDGAGSSPAPSAGFAEPPAPAPRPPGGAPVAEVEDAGLREALDRLGARVEARGAAKTQAEDDRRRSLTKP